MAPGGAPSGTIQPSPLARTRSAGAPMSNTAQRRPACHARLRAKLHVSGQTEGNQARWPALRPHQRLAVLLRVGAGHEHPARSRTAPRRPGYGRPRRTRAAGRVRPRRGRRPAAPRDPSRRPARRPGRCGGRVPGPGLSGRPRPTRSQGTTSARSPGKCRSSRRAASRAGTTTRPAPAKSAAERARSAAGGIGSSIRAPTSAMHESHTLVSSGSPQKRRSGPTRVIRGQMQA